MLAARAAARALHMAGPEPARVAVIGGGLAGLACAAELAAGGRGPVDVFDMGARGPGGRASSKTVEHGGSRLLFDYGAQFFSCRTPQCAVRFRQWEAAGARAHIASVRCAGAALGFDEELDVCAVSAGVLRRWEGRVVELRAPARQTIAAGKAGHPVGSEAFCGWEPGVELYVGVPSSDAVCRHLARTPGVRVVESTKVSIWSTARLGNLYKPTIRARPQVSCS